MLTLMPIRRDERAQLFTMADAYWREIRPTGDHFAHDPAARSKYFDDEFWNEREGEAVCPGGQSAGARFLGP